MMPFIYLTERDFFGRFKEQLEKRRLRTVLVCLVAWLAVGQPVYAQDKFSALTGEVSFSAKSAQAASLFDALQKQCEYVFAYDRRELEGVQLNNLSWQKTPLSTVLCHLQNEYGLSFLITGKNIAVVLDPAFKKKETAIAEQTTALVRGRVVDFETSEPLPNSTILLSGAGKTVVSDEKGYYVIKGVSPGNYILLVTHIGYQPNRTDHVQPAVGKELVMDIRMQAGGNGKLAEVVVTTAGRKLRTVTHTTEKQVVAEIRAASSVISGISSERISKGADRNAAEVVRRISGITIKDDRFAVVRGMDPRYNLTYLNDNIAPSTEVYTRSFAFDLIPSRIIDRILVYKSPSVDLMGDMAGGAIKIYTKDARFVKHFDLELQVGVRPQTTFNKHFLTYNGGRLDFLGMDDGSRKLPGVVPGYGNFTKANIGQHEYVTAFSPVLQYGEQAALPNLQVVGTYYNSFKLLKKNVSTLTSVGYKLENQHNDVYRQQGFPIGTGAGESANDKTFFENRNSENAQLNLLQNFSVQLRDSSKLYFKNFLLQQGQKSTVVRTSHATWLTDSVAGARGGYSGLSKDNVLSWSQRFLYAGNIGGTHYYHSGMHRLQWNGGYTFSRQSIPDQRVIRLETVDGWGNFGNSIYMGYPELQWRPRNRTSQPQGEGDDSRILNGMISRVWIRNTEGIYNGSADYTFTPTSYLAIKAGTFHQWKKRELYRRIYTVNEGDLRGGFEDYITPIGEYGDYIDWERVAFKEKELGNLWSDEYFREDNSGLKVFDRTSGSDAYIGTQQNNSGYVSVNFMPGHRAVEVNGGVRIEYDRQKVAGAIPSVGNQANVNQPVLIDIKKTSLLPCVNASVRMVKNWILRGAYGRTLNRPEFREVSPYADRDYESNEVVRGNPALRPATIDNYDLRLEYYPHDNDKGESIMAGVFYKKLQQPIERIISTQRSGGSFNVITFENAPQATIKGFEAELTKKLDFLPGRFMRDLTLVANAAIIESEVKREPTAADSNRVINRPLQGQAPYIINVALYYDKAATGTRVSLSYNTAGARIYATGPPYVHDGVNQSSLYRGSIIELPRHLLDLSLTQRLVKSLQLKFNVQNLLDAPLEMAEDYNHTYKYEKAREITTINVLGNEVKDMEGDNITSRYKPGRYYLLSLTYSF